MGSVNLMAARRRLIPAFVLLVAGAASAGEAPTAVAEYPLTGSLDASAPTAPPLTPTRSDERLAASFVVDVVDGIARAVYEMPAVELNDDLSTAGLDLDGAALGLTTTYTLELLAAFAVTDDYAKLADFSQRVLDEGWYVYENSSLFYEETDEGDPLLIPEAYFLLTLTRTAAGLIAIYIDGVPVASFDDVENLGVVPGPVSLFIDDTDTLDENTTTRAARVAVFATALSPAEVLARAEARDTDRRFSAGFEDIPGIPQAR